MPKEQGSVPLYKLEEIANNWSSHYLDYSFAQRSLSEIAE